MSKVVLYKLLIHCNTHLKQLYLSKNTSAFVMKVGVVDMNIPISSHLKEELA